MTIPVAASELHAVLGRFASAALITHSEPYVKVLTCDPTMDGDDVVVTPVRESTVRNVHADSHVTLIWQQHVHHGWTLIVDGVGAWRWPVRCCIGRGLMRMGLPGKGEG